MIRRVWFYLTLSAMLIIFYPTTASAKKVSRTDDFIISAKGIKTIHFRNIVFTDLTYKGGGDTDSFAVRFEKIVKNGDDEEIEDIFSRLDLDITTSGGTVTIDLIHPKTKTSGILNHIFDRKEWSVKLEITGPSEIVLDINADFSEIRTSSTVGKIIINSDFSDTVIQNHTGKIDADTDFSRFKCDGLDGTFDVNSDFSDVTLKLVYLAGNSQVKATFGRTDITLPVNTGAVFHVEKTLAGVNFDTSGSLTYEGHKGSRRVLSGGGPRIDLNVEFGKITVRDNQEKKRVTGTVYHEAADEVYGVLPLTRGAWWKYSSDGENLTLKVEKIRDENGNETATLSFDKNDASPFESIDVYETGKGLYISGISGRFFGRDLSGVRFEPAKLWLPYEKNAEPEGSDILGSVRMKELEDTMDTPAGTMIGVLHYTIKYGSHPPQEISLASGVGFVSFGDFKLTAYDTGVSKPEPEQSKLSEPRFEEGTVTSIKIKIRDEHLISEPDVSEILDIKRENIYTRKEVSETVSNLREKHRFIEHAYYNVDTDGNLAVTVYEIEPLKKIRPVRIIQPYRGCRSWPDAYYKE